MRIPKEIRLLQLAEQIEAAWPDIVVGWDLGLEKARPDDADIILEVFSVQDERELEFLSLILPFVRAAEKDLEANLLVLSHEPEATESLYVGVPERIKRARTHLHAEEDTQTVKRGRLGSRHPNFWLRPTG